jgi:spermidine synthase
LALVWEKSTGSIHYAVRSAGAALRLYTNGAFHSQYNPNYLFTGAVWDLLTLPSLYIDTDLKNVLLLGVGGGAAIHQINQLHQPTKLYGVELDKTHILIARSIFGVNYPNTQLIHAEASAWLTESSTALKFDYIIDDIFAHGELEPERPFEPDNEWANLLTSRLTPNGFLVQNHIDRTAAMRFLKKAKTTLRQRFNRVIAFETLGYENYVLAFFKTEKPFREMKKLAQYRLNNLPAKATSRLRHRSSEIR